MSDLKPLRGSLERLRTSDYEGIYSRKANNGCDKGGGHHYSQEWIA
jgi:hypothetical protein